MIFQKDFLVLLDGRVVALKFIESMRFPSEGEDRTVAALKDDLDIEMITISGKEYVTSTRSQYYQSDWRIEKEGIMAGRTAIFEKWCHILTGKST
jgi:hypothetical protein